MPNDELAKRVAGYADAITAFAFLQSLTFSYALGTNEKFLANAVKAGWYVPLAIAVGNLLYLYLVCQCQRAELDLLDSSGDLRSPWEKKVRRWRIAIIVIALVVSLSAYGLSWLGTRHATTKDSSGRFAF